MFTHCCACTDLTGYFWSIIDAFSEWLINWSDQPVVTNRLCSWLAYLIRSLFFFVMVSVWWFTLTFVMTFMMSVAWFCSLHGSNLKFFQKSFKLLQVHWFVFAIFLEQAVDKRFCSWSIYAPSVDMRENMTICRADKGNKAKKRENLPRAPWTHCKVVLRQGETLLTPLLWCSWARVVFWALTDDTSFTRPTGEKA